MSADDSAKAFEILGDETRIAIIKALAKERRESPENLPLSFSELRDRADVGDSGRFNYHLDKLAGHFIEQTEDGYNLNRIGRLIAGAVTSGYYEGETVEVDSFELEPCPLCDEVLEADYEDGNLRVGCSNNHEFNTWVPPRAFHDRTIESVVELGATAAIWRLRQIQRGSCPLCFGHVELDLIPTEDDPDIPVPAVHAGRCRACGQGFTTTPGTLALLAPRVQAKMTVHGDNMWEAPVRWFIDEGKATIDSFDASTGRVTVTQDLESVRLTVTIDEQGGMKNVDVQERPTT